MEFFNVYTRYGEKTDEIVERQDAHKRGICHRVFHLWIINSNNQVLVQQRSAMKDTGANLWYVSVGGHIESDETIEQAIVREAKEELGLDIAPIKEEIQYLYTFKESISENNGIIDNEFYDVFILKYDVPLEQIVMQTSEVQAVKYMDYAEFIHVLEHQRNSFVPHEVSYKLLAIALDNYLSQTPILT